MATVRGRMGSVEYRDFPIQVSRVSPRSGRVRARVAGPLPGGQPSYDEQERGVYATDLFVMQQNGVTLELGYLNFDQERYAEAGRCFRATLAISDGAHYRRGQAQALHALGNTAFARQQFDTAAKDYAAALAINTELQHTADAAYNRYQLAVVDQRRGKLEEAESAYAVVRATARAIGDVALEAAVLLQLSSVWLRKGYKQQAEASIGEALALGQQVNDRLTQAAALYYQGLFQAQSGHLDEAKDTLVAARGAYVALGSINAATAKLALARLERSRRPGDVEAGVGILEKALTSRTKTRRRKRSQSQDPDIYRILSGGSASGWSGYATFWSTDD